MLPFEQWTITIERWTVTDLNLNFLLLLYCNYINRGHLSVLTIWRIVRSASFLRCKFLFDNQGILNGSFISHYCYVELYCAVQAVHLNFILLLLTFVLYVQNANWHWGFLCVLLVVVFIISHTASFYSVVMFGCFMPELQSYNRLHPWSNYIYIYICIYIYIYISNSFFACVWICTNYWKTYTVWLATVNVALTILHEYIVNS